MATYIAKNCFSCAQKIKSNPSSLYRNLQLLTPCVSVLTTIPSRNIDRKRAPKWIKNFDPRHHGNVNNSERFKAERRRKANLTKEDKKRLELMEKHRLDPSASIKYRLKHAGMKIGPPSMSRPITITCTSDVFEPYVPPEGDGKKTFVTAEGAKQRLERVKNLGKSRISMRKIRKYEPEYDNSEFAWKAQQIFIDAHNAFQFFDRHLLHSLTTEKCYPDMVSGNRYKTFRWKFLESIEKPRVVHIRCTDMIDRNNTFAQVTVRMHSKQILAIYDRWGRLMLGSEETPKDVLEYAVFEKHLPNRNGAWRLHAKIAPPWALHREPLIKTMVLPQFEDEVEEDEGDVSKDETVDTGKMQVATQ